MIINFIKGIFIGLALVIPGLSASTFAVVLGIYEKLIESLNSFRKQAKQSLKFLLPIGAGAAAGILASVGFLLFVIDRFPIPSYAFFIGLVLGSIPVIYRRMKPGLPQKFNFVFLVLGLAVILTLSFFTPTTVEGEYGAYITYITSFGEVAIIFAAGFIACLLIMFPGVSGAMILILIGQFDTVYGAASNFASSIMMTFQRQEGAWYLGLNALLILLIFFVGAVIGLVIASKLIAALLQKREHTVYFAVMGLVIGAVYILFNIGIQDPIAYTFSRGEFLPILRDVALIASAIALGYICTGLMGRGEKKGAKA
ncbi:MAG: DUF368 domain-containing protein [Defluviitaleaceae bacterium]|nr:DUF368 domain-containing protein [Defluviitaleaceae bacterium]